MVGTWYCRKCKQEKPETEFYRRAGRKHQYWCKACVNGYVTQWHKNHPQANTKSCERWRAKHPDYFLNRSEQVQRAIAEKRFRSLYGDNWESHWNGPVRIHRSKKVLQSV
jgi:hypothetical protein